MAIKNINDEVQWDAVCRQLIRLTNEGVIEWSDWSGTIGRPNSRSPLFVASYKQWQILIYRYASKHWRDEEDFDWEEDVGMELINNEGTTRWVFPRVPSRHKLLDHIQFASANVKGLLDDILGDGDG